jgi:hypothetical protein
MRQLFVTIALVTAALVITFGVAATLEHTAFKAGPEPGVGAPSGTMPPPGEKRGRTGRHVA